MSTVPSSWWANCALEPDDKEIQAIDALENSIAPLDDQTARIRELIGSLEMCHHKAERWVEVIIEAIGAGSTSKGPGTRSPGRRHPVEQVWQNCHDVLSSWCSCCPSEAMDLDVGGIPGHLLMSFIGDRTLLKVWQAQRIVEKTRAFLEPSFGYAEIEGRGEDPEFRDLTVQTVIHDTVDGRDAEITLAGAIDHLEPCHWDFVGNLGIVLKAIGGDLFPEKPFATCGDIIKLAPIRDRMEVVSDTLGAFCEGRDTGKGVDVNVLGVLGEETPVKHWLAASLDKTIRLQLGL